MTSAPLGGTLQRKRKPKFEIVRVPKALRYLPQAKGIIALAWLMAIIVVVRNILLGVPEIVPFGEELGTLLNTVGLSYIGAFLFNYLVVALPKRRDMRHTLEVAAPLIYNLPITFSRMLRDLYSQSGDGMPVIADYESLKRALVRVGAHAESSATTLEDYQFPPKMLTNLELIKRTASSVELQVNRLTPMFANLDVELATLIFKLPTTGFVELSKYVKPELYNLDTLEVFATSMYNYWRQMDALYVLFKAAVDAEAIAMPENDFKEPTFNASDEV